MSLSPAKVRRTRKPVTINQQILAALVGVNMLVTVLFSVAFYARQKNTVMADIDTTLYAVATLARATLPADYHDRITAPSSVSDSEFQKIVDRNNRLCKSLGLEYIWSLMLVDGRVVFTTSTSPDKVAENRKHAAFFEPHSNPEFYLPTFESMRPTYRTNHDKWGHNRVALLPFVDAHGRKCLFGACFSLAEVDRHLRSLVRQATGIGFALFAVSMAVGFWVTRRITRPIHQLTETIQGIAAGQSDLVASEFGSSEQVILARQFNLMNRALQDKISELQAARERLIERHDTELKQTEEELVLSEQRYRALLNFAVDGILVGTADETIIEANECMCAFFGMPRSEVIGRHIREMPFTPESVQRTPFRFERVQTGEMVVSERSIRRPDGSEIVIEMHTKMMADGTFQSIYRDVTERKRTEDSLRETRSMLEEAQRMAKLGAWKYEVATQRFIWTDEVYRIHGVGRDFDINNLDTDVSFFTPESRPVIKQAFLGAVEQGVPYDLELAFVRADGEHLWVRASALPVVENGKVVHVDGNFMDITERKQAEEKLVSNERRYRALLNFAVDGILVGDPDGTIVEANERMCALFGLARAEIIGKQIREMPFTPESLARSPFRFDLLKQGEMIVSERAVRRSDGSEIIVEMHSKVMADGTYQSIFRDITRRKQTEDELRRNQEEISRQNETFAALLHNLNVGVFMVEAPSGKPLVANEAACRLLGRGVLPDADSFSLGDVYEAYRGSDRVRYPVDEMPIALGMKGVSAHVEDLVVVRPDGTEARLEIFGTPVKDGQGRVWASLVSFVDITERKRVELALRESEDRYRQLFEMESDAIFLIDNEAGRILDVNLAAQTLYGYSRDELLAKRNADLSAEPEQTRLLTQRAADESPALLRIALRQHRKCDGTVFPVEIAARSFNMNGRPVHIAAIRDITERRKAQELMESWNTALERRVAERTAEADKRMHQLQRLTAQLIRAEENERQRISDVLHEDLQQTLVATRMTLGVALEPVRNLGVQESLQRVDDMLSQAIRLTRTLVQEIAVPSVKEGELPAAIGWIASQMQEKFGVKVTLKVGKGLEPVSENVYLCLYRAVQEILFNVVKHAHVKEAEITIREDTPQLVRVTVTDRGCGFSAAALEAAGRAGSGVGLYGIRERIEGLGGHMEIVSDAGAGASVILTVPAHDTPDEAGLSRGGAARCPCALTPSGVSGGRALPERFPLTEGNVSGTIRAHENSTLRFGRHAD